MRLEDAAGTQTLLPQVAKPFAHHSEIFEEQANKYGTQRKGKLGNRDAGALD